MAREMSTMGANLVREIFEATNEESKPFAVVFVPSIVPDEVTATFPIIEKLVSHRLPVFLSFVGAASAISKVIKHREAKR